MALSKNKVLIIDNDEAFVSAASVVLEAAGHEVYTATSGHFGWNILKNVDVTFDAVMLERIMPDMDGFELLLRIKGRWKNKLPVIIHSQDIEPKSIHKGIDLGAYYYLTKPVDLKMMLAVISSAIKEKRFYQQISADANTRDQTVGLLEKADFRFSTVEEATNVAMLLAVVCPDTGRAAQGLCELTVNAIEHGNLGLDYQEKKQAIVDGTYAKEISRRTSDAIKQKKSATITFEKINGSLNCVVEDQGTGFDHTPYMELDPARLADPNGRGIALAAKHSFTKLEYENGGSKAIATISLE